MEAHLLVLLEAVRKTQTGIKLQLAIHYSYLANASLGARVSMPVLFIPGSQKEAKFAF